MLPTESYSFVRYLAAKKSVDDRAINRHVWQTLQAGLAELSPVKPLRVLEIGAGIGTMIERMLDWGLLQRTELTALDADVGNIAHFRQRLPAWAESRGWLVERTGVDEIQLSQQERRIHILLETANLFTRLPKWLGRVQWDLLVANAFLDLVDLPSTLPLLLRLLAPSGWFYFTINYDGISLFEPAYDAALDAQIMALYHRSMDERRIDNLSSGDSRTGRHLFHYLSENGATIVAAGSSDWTVFASQGAYPQDEAYFLRFILATIQRELYGHPELPSADLTRWIRARSAQIDRGELVYIAHQLDFAGQVGSNP